MQYWPSCSAWALNRSHLLPNDGQGGAQSIAQAAIYLLCVVQFSLLWYNPIAQLPTDEDKRAGHQLIEQIAAVDGPVFLPFHGYYAHMSGKTSMAHQMAVRDVLRSQDSQQSEALMDDLRARVKTPTSRARVAINGTLYALL